MRPSLGRVVIYTRGVGEEYAATITRVGTPNGVLQLENDYDVWLAVDIHDEPRGLDDRSHGRRWYTHAPVKFDGSETPAANTWRWPPRV